MARERRRGAQPRQRCCRCSEEPSGGARHVHRALATEWRMDRLAGPLLRLLAHLIRRGVEFLCWARPEPPPQPSPVFAATLVRPVVRARASGRAVRRSRLGSSTPSGDQRAGLPGRIHRGRGDRRGWQEILHRRFKRVLLLLLNRADAHDTLPGCDRRLDHRSHTSWHGNHHTC